MRRVEDRPLYMGDDYTQLSGGEAAIASHLKEHGYAILRSFVDEELIDKVVQDCHGKYRNDSVHLNENRRIADAWRSIESVSRVASDERVINLLSSVYGRKAFPFQTLNFEIGTEQRLHSDTIHFDSIPSMYMTGVWVAYEKVTMANGPLRYLQNSHKLPIFNYGSIGVRPASPKEDPYLNYSLYEDFVEELAEGMFQEPSFVEMEKGDVFIWSANLIHGGSQILDENLSRLSQVTHYYYEGCIYFTPLRSDPGDAKIQLRLPINISEKKRIRLITLLANMRTHGFSWRSILRSLLHSKKRI